jgi:hypothetical protein
MILRNIEIMRLLQDDFIQTETFAIRTKPSFLSGML